MYVFVGARDQRLREAVDVALGHPPTDDMSYTGLDASDCSLSDIQTACSMPSMFGGRRKVFLENAQVMAGRSSPLTEWLGAFARAARADPASDLCDLAVAAYIDLGDRRNSARAATFTKLKSAGAQIEEFRPLRARDVVTFVQRRGRDRGIEITPQAAQRLAELVTTEAGLLASEIDKLASYAGFSGTIDEADVDEASATIGEHARWDYINAVSDRRLDDALGVLHDMLGLRVPAQLILSDVATALRRLWVAKQTLAAGGDAAAVARATRQPEFRARQLAQRARRMPERLIARMFAELVRTDAGLKSTGSDRDALLEILTARLAARPDRPVRA